MWDEKSSQASSYLDYTQRHLESLVSLRFLPDDWPGGLSNLLINLNGWELLMLSDAKKNISENELQSFLNGNREAKPFGVNQNALLKQLTREGLNKQDFTSWSGQDLIYDFYKVKNGDELALDQIKPARLKAYKLLFKLFSEKETSQNLADLKQFAAIFQKQLNAAPAANFSIDLKTG